MKKRGHKHPGGGGPKKKTGHMDQDKRLLERGRIKDQRRSGPRWGGTLSRRSEIPKKLPRETKVRFRNKPTSGTVSEIKCQDYTKGL